MGLINTEIEININGRNASYYEDLGYKIPKYLDKRNNCFRVKNGTKIVVKINDLSFGSSAKVDVECDYCRKRYITEKCGKPTPLGVGWIAHLFYNLMCMYVLFLYTYCDMIYVWKIIIDTQTQLYL